MMVQGEEKRGRVGKGGKGSGGKGETGEMSPGDAGSTECGEGKEPKKNVGWDGTPGKGGGAIPLYLFIGGEERRGTSERLAAREVLCECVCVCV